MSALERLAIYHNAFLIQDDIEDESWWRRGKPTTHIDHGIPIAINVGDPGTHPAPPSWAW